MSGQQATVQIARLQPLDHDNKGSIENLTWCVTKNVKGIARKHTTFSSRLSSHIPWSTCMQIYTSVLMSCRSLIDAHFMETAGSDQTVQCYIVHGLVAIIELARMPSVSK